MTGLYDKGKAEVKANLPIFKEMQAELQARHPGKVALFHNRQYVDVFDSIDEACDEGCKRFGKACFSVQAVEPKPLNMGAMSRLAARLVVS